MIVTSGCWVRSAPKENLEKYIQVKALTSRSIFFFLFHSFIYFNSSEVLKHLIFFIHNLHSCVQSNLEHHLSLFLSFPSLCPVVHFFNCSTPRTLYI